MNATPGVPGPSTRSTSGTGHSATASSPAIFYGRLVHDAAGLSGIVETIVGNSIPDHVKKGYKSTADMTTHLGKMSAMSPPEAERMNAEQAIIVARVLTDIESLVASVAKRIAVSQNHSDFTSGMGGYVLVDLDASARFESCRSALLQQRRLMETSRLSGSCLRALTRRRWTLKRRLPRQGRRPAEGVSQLRSVFSGAQARYLDSEPISSS